MAKNNQTSTQKPATKSELYAAIAEDTGLAKKDVAAVFESLTGQIKKHIKPRSVGTFNLPGLAKITVVKKAATKERKGINPFTGEPAIFKAKPASRVVKVRALKGLKDLAS